MFPSSFTPNEYKATFLPRGSAMPIKLKWLDPIFSPIFKALRLPTTRKKIQMGLKKKFKNQEFITWKLQSIECKQSQSSHKIRTRPIPRNQYEISFLLQKVVRGYQFKGKTISALIRSFIGARLRFKSRSMENTVKISVLLEDGIGHSCSLQAILLFHVSQPLFLHY